MAYRLLGSNREHHKAMLRNMVTSLIKHERIETTEAKAKELRKLADRMITLAKQGDRNARVKALGVVREKPMVDKLFDVLGKRYIAREGGYTRILKTRFRLSDRAPMCYIEYVDRPGELRAPRPAALLKQPGITTDLLLKQRENRIRRSYARKTVVNIAPGTKQTHHYMREGKLPRIFMKEKRVWLSGKTTAQVLEIKRRQEERLANFGKPGAKAARIASAKSGKNASDPVINVAVDQKVKFPSKNNANDAAKKL